MLGKPRRYEEMPLVASWDERSNLSRSPMESAFSISSQPLSMHWLAHWPRSDVWLVEHRQQIVVGPGVLGGRVEGVEGARPERLHLAEQVARLWSHVVSGARSTRRIALVRRTRGGL